MNSKKILMALATAGLLVLAGCGEDTDKKPDHPKKSEHPKSEGSAPEQAKPEHPK